MSMAGLAQSTSEFPKVSIGMPVYNGEKYLREALDSLLAQTYTDFELIISDNASTDGTEGICRGYTADDPRIRYVRQAENKGGAANFQFALDEAQCKYFMWAAHDDEWSRGYLREAVAVLDGGHFDFVFPRFSVRSIRLKIGKKFDERLFEFIESRDRRDRVLKFVALHHNSHKCNIIYSLFRTGFLRTALKIQDISNDGALGSVILGLGRGKLLSNASFSKRYPLLWPGALNALFAWFYKNRSKEFEVAKESALNRLLVLFPEYGDDIKMIFNCYEPFIHEKGYEICSIGATRTKRTILVSENNRPTVSIGMPVYNGENFIQEAIDSLLAQTFTDFELIISDNASKDSTASICQIYSKQDPRIHYTRQQENIGALRNFQFVLSEASGEYFMWAACDDKWDRNWIKMLHLRLEETRNFAAFGKLRQIDTYSRPLEHPANHNSFEFTGTTLKRRTSFFIEFEGKGKANLFYSLFRRETLAGIDLIRDDIDYIALFDLLNKIGFVSVNDVFLYKRIHASGPGNVETKSLEQQLWDIVTLKFFWRDICVARNYLNHSRGGEKFLLSLLVPVKIFHNYFFYAHRVLNKLSRHRG